MSWSIYAGAGYGRGEDGYVNMDIPGVTESLKQEGPVVTAGFGFRKYFTRVLGVQARASLLVGAGKGFVAGALADGTLRFGPFGTGFPWFFGGGLFLGPAYLARDSGSDVKVFGGGVAETGFMFGDRDRIEIVLRAYVGAASLLQSDVGLAIYPVLVMGYRL